MTESKQDWPAIVGLGIIGIVAVISVLFGEGEGLQVASAAVGGVAGWLARSSGKTANIEHADSVQADSVATAQDSVPSHSGRAPSPR